jgi:type II secretory pathway predicted ATPase ExeA
MYETHFGLRRRPFRPTPDTDSYYPATTHEVALDSLVQALQGGEGHVLLTGKPGTGKTLLCHRLIDRLGGDRPTAFVTNTHLNDRIALLQAILYELSLPYEGRSEQKLRLALTDHLLQSFQAARPALVLIDEAHHLSVDLLEELRLLGNLESPRSKAVQIVLVAQPAISQTLEDPALWALAQRLAVRPIIDPLGQDEAADYIVHQLRTAGARPEALISDEALTILAKGARGIPRLLNQSAHNAFLLAQAAEAGQVDAEAALEALSLLGLSADAVADEGADTAALNAGPAEDGSSDEARVLTPATVLPEEEEVARFILPPRRPA